MMINETFGLLTVKKHVGKGKYLCQCSCGNKKVVYGGHLKCGSTKSCGCLQKSKIGKSLIGRKFNRLTVIEHVGRSHYKCLCDCGNEAVVYSSKIRSGHTKSCGCYGADVLRNARWCGYEDISGSYYNNVKVNARSRNLSLNITIEDIWDQYVLQDGLCYLSGIPIFFTKDYQQNPTHQTASVDRIDSSIGYTRQNIGIAYKHVNIMKRNHSVADFIRLCHMITKPFYIPVDYHIQERRSNWKGYKDISKRLWSQIIRNAGSRDIEFDITIKDVWEQFVAQGHICALTGYPLFFKNRYHDQTASLDRIDSDLGYVSGNIQWVHKDINFMKKNHPQDYFLYLCRQVSEYNSENSYYVCPPG